MVPCDAIVELWIHVEVEHSSVWAKSAGKCSEVHSVFFFFLYAPAPSHLWNKPRPPGKSPLGEHVGLI